MVEALESYNGVRYNLGAWVVMPNHVHVVVRPEPGVGELDAITRSWKGYTARKINAVEGRPGRFWQGESYDSIIRDAEHLYRVVQYIGNNPGKAGLAGKCPLWVRPEWMEAGFGFGE